MHKYKTIYDIWLSEIYLNQTVYMYAFTDVCKLIIKIDTLLLLLLKHHWKKIIVI